MALRAAVASGNWSNPTIWNGGVLPGPGDVVACNTYTVTIDQNINVDQLTNTAQSKTNAIPTMTSNTTPSGVASSNVGVAWQAFDNSGSYWLAQATVPGDYVEYEFPTPKAIDQYEFVNGTTFNNGSVSLQAWDGTSWITLHTASSVTLPNAGSYTYTSPSIGNSTSYLKYRFVVNSAFYVQIHTVRMYEYLGLQPATAGGGFILNDGVTVTCTGLGILTGAVTCLTYSGTGSVTINANISGVAAINTNAFLISGTGTVIINGTVNGDTSANGSNNTINVTAAATLNVTGKINGYNGVRVNATTIRMTASGSVLNLIGDIETRGTAKDTVVLSTGTTLNMTGDAYCNFNTANSGRSINANSAVVNITGNVYIANTTGANTDWYALVANNSCTINIVGTVSADPGPTAMTGGSNAVIIGGTPSYYNHVGPIIGGFRHPAFQSTGTSNINILSGPFISSPEGIQPLYVTRMHYQRTMGSYFEFRDSSTNGALPPAAPAPATRLVSPDTVVDAPVPANVRQGVVYASGSQTGTMVVPSPSNVTINVPVDNTVGTAILNADNLWAIDTSTMNTANSIGERLKNAATVQTVGDQLVSLL